MPEPTPDLHSAHSRTLQFADKLFAALEDLQAAGGLARLAAENPRSAERAAQVLKSARQMIDDQLADYKASRRN